MPDTRQAPHGANAAVDDPRPDLSAMQKVSLNGQVMEPSGVIRRALFDPGIFVRRDDNYNEPLHRWQARAVEEALRLADYKITEAFPPANAGERKEYIAVGRGAERERIVKFIRAEGEQYVGHKDRNDLADAIELLP